MGSRGKKSGADLASVPDVPDGSVTTISRPGPPSELTEEQAYEWLKVTNRMPADWFPEETHGLLVQYCRWVVDARRVAQLIDALTAGDDFNVKEYKELLAMQDVSTAKISMLATRMRISQQSTIERERKKPTMAKKPWES